MRKTTIAITLSSVALLWAPAALPCGGAFGYGLKLNPDQKIVLRHKSGVETYFFSPHFCGQSAHFGLILPVPSQLVAPPKVGDAQTVSQLEDVTKAQIVPRTVCYTQGHSNGGGGSKAAGGVPSTDAGASVQVIDKGKVGIFEYTVLKADTAKAFTDWLDANQYPYDTAASTQFSAYVTSGWYFVAFKVTADSQDPPQGKQICGDLGPIQLSFQTDNPVIPSRIAAASSASDAGLYTSQLQWRVFAVANHEVTSSVVSPSKRFSGALSDQDIATHSALNNLAVDEEHVTAGERVTELDFTFYPGQMSSDLLFQAAATDTDYRRTEYRDTYIECLPDGGPIPDPDAAGAGGTAKPDAATFMDASLPVGKGGAVGQGGAATGAGGTTAARGTGGAGSSAKPHAAGGATGKGGSGNTHTTAAKGGAAGATTESESEPESHGGGCTVSSESRSPASTWMLGLGAALSAWAVRRRRRSG